MGSVNMISVIPLGNFVITKSTREPILFVVQDLLSKTQSAETRLP